MKRLVGMLLVSVALVGAAQAADFSPGAAPGWAASGWNGFYAGVEGGFGWGQADFPANGAPASLGMSGGLLGAEVGYDVDLGRNIVGGLAGDLSWANITGTTCVNSGGCSGAPDDSYATGTIDWLSTFRGRLGFASNGALFYGTAGLAYAHSNATITNVTGLGDTWKASTGAVGWVVGGGAEAKMSRHVSVGAEALYVDLGTTSYSFSDGGAPTAVPTKVTDGIVRAFMNYRF